jgi:hypothetical protein
VKRAAVAVGCVVAGLAAGVLWTLLQSDAYRADARVLVRPASARIVPAVEALAESSLIETNIAQTLHLSSAPTISATRGDSGVLTLAVVEGSRERARQVDAEAVVLLMQKVSERFRGVGVTATVLDPAHVAEQTSPTPGRNLLITGLAGLAVGLAIAAALSGPGRVVDAGATAPDPRVERRLNARIDQVAQRERALARRAGQLAAREDDLERRERQVAAKPPVPESEPVQHPEPQPALESVSEQEPVALPSVLSGPWNLAALEDRVRAAQGRFPERAEEWNTYLFLLREHADVDGTLPPSFDALVADVFADVVGR